MYMYTVLYGQCSHPLHQHTSAHITHTNTHHTHTPHTHITHTSTHTITHITHTITHITHTSTHITHTHITHTSSHITHTHITHTHITHTSSHITHTHITHTHITAARNCRGLWRMRGCMTWSIFWTFTCTFCSGNRWRGGQWCVIVKSQRRSSGEEGVVGLYLKPYVNNFKLLMPKIYEMQRIIGFRQFNMGISNIMKPNLPNAERHPSSYPMLSYTSLNDWEKTILKESE